MWTEVNGAKIEDSFLQENIREAKGYLWSSAETSALTEHVHCLVCGVTVGPQSSQKLYRSERNWLCDYCHDHFIQ